MNKVTQLTTNNELNDNFLLNGRGNPEKTSSKYRGASSQEMIESLEESGLVVRSISEPRARKAENLPFNKHMIRLTTQENLDLLKTREVGISIPEVVIINNNNNRGSLQVLLGIFRLVCSNGMIVGQNFNSHKIRHDKNFSTNLLNALINTRENFDRSAFIVEAMKGIELSSNEVLNFRQNILESIIIPNLTDKNTIDLNIKSNFNPQRKEDFSRDLWTIFNRYQEYLLRGGIKYQKTIEKVEDGEKILDLKNGTTRAVNSIDRQVKLNQQLMDLTLNHFNIAA